MFGGTLPQLSKIDELTLGDHSYLGADDACYYFGEYTAREGFSAGPTNQFIYNFKKPVSRRGLGDWRYKERAIAQAADAFSKRLDPGFLRSATLVPMPPSKRRDDPAYDDRILQMLRGIVAPHVVDVRELIMQTGERAAAHEGNRPSPAGLEAVYGVDEACCDPAPSAIGLFDDLLVTGASFKAGKAILQRRFPGVTVYGVFLARRAVPNPFADFASEE